MADGHAAEKAEMPKASIRAFVIWGGALLVAGALLIAVYCVDNWKLSPTALGVGLMWATAMGASGGLLGLLFGIPRAMRSRSEADRNRYRENTNLEEVSDWLTKVLVGASLTQIGGILDRLAQVGEFLSPALARESDKTNAAAAFAIGITVFYFIAGFVIGYVLTRVKLREVLDGVDGNRLETSTAGPAPVSG